MIKVKIVPCESGEPPKVYGGLDVRKLLVVNTRFRVMWIGGIRYENRYGNQAHVCACGETFATKYGMRMHAEAMHP